MRLFKYMEHMPVNGDIMHLIMGHSDRGSVSKIMQTCRSFYCDGARYLVADLVEIQSDEISQVESFVSFMMADHPHRFPFLRTLALSLNSRAIERACWDNRLAATHSLLRDLFISLSAFGTNFTTLILRDAESILGAHPNLLDAIASLPQVRMLSIDYVDQHSRRMLRRFASSVVSACLTMPTVAAHPRMSGEARDLTLLLHASQSTLEKLEVSNCASFDGPQFPRMASLTLVSQQSLCTHRYAHAFPNLHILDVVAANIAGLDSADRTFPRLSGLRDENVALQRVHGTWKSLQEVYGTPSILYVLGITCPVVRLGIFSEPGHNPMEPRYLRQVIHDAKPRHLAVAIPSGSALSDPALVSVFYEPCVRRLQTLEMGVSIKPADVKRGVILRAMLVSLRSAMSHSDTSAHEVMDRIPSATLSERPLSPLSNSVSGGGSSAAHSPRAQCRSFPFPSRWSFGVGISSNSRIICSNPYPR